MLAVAIVTHKAWVSDDAYITFRCIENLLSGLGLGWNAGERVQAYTHPAWMLTMAALRLATGEFFYTAVCAGLVLTLAALGVLVGRLAASQREACLALALLAMSRAFTDYSTSGLENALSHLLLALLLWLTLAGRSASPHPALVSLLASLLVLSRPDLLLLALPAWTVAALGGPPGRAAASVALGAAPLLMWEAFSIFYYGMPVPNTAFAKLDTGLGAGELAAQGLRYLENSLRWDPLTLATLCAGVAIALRRGGRERTTWALGIVLYVAYLVRIGGDFMTGRLLTPPLWVAVALLIERPLRLRVVAPATLAVWAVALIPFYSPLVERDYGERAIDAIDAHGIADERAFYRKQASARSSWGKQGFPGPGRWLEAKRIRRRWPADDFTPRLRRWGTLSPSDIQCLQRSDVRRRVVVRGAVGFLGFYLGPEFHILDYYALADPLLARLPVTLPDPVLVELMPKLAPNRWRVGHYYRSIPPGYACSIATGENRIANRALAEYYEVVKRITQGPLLDGERLRAIWHLHRGEYDALLERARRAPGPGAAPGGVQDPAGNST